MSTASRIIKNSGYLYIRIVVTAFLSLYTTRLVLDALGATDFGIFNLVGGVIAMLGFLNAAMTQATQRFMSYNEGKGSLEEKKQIFNVSLFLHISIAILLSLLLIILGWFCFSYILSIPQDRLNASVVIYGCLIVSTALGIMNVPYDAILNAHENMLYYSLIGILDAVLRLVIAFLLFIIDYDRLLVYGILMSLIPVFIFIIVRIYCHKHYEECYIDFKKFFNKHLAKEITCFAGWSFLSNVANVLAIQGSSIVLNRFGGVLVNAAHGVANQLAGYLLVFSSNMQKALNPVIVKKEGENNRIQMIAYAISGSKFSFLLFALFAVPFYIEMPYILRLWLKNPPEYSVIFCRLIILRRLFGQITSSFTTAIGATGKIKQNSIVNFVIMILSLPIAIIIYYLNAPIYSIYIVMLIMVILTSCSNIYFMHHQCGMIYSNYVKEVLLPCAVVLVITYSISSVLSFCLKESFLRLIIICIITILIFCLLSYRLALNTQEKGMVVSMVKNVNRRVLKLYNSL